MIYKENDKQDKKNFFKRENRERRYKKTNFNIKEKLTKSAKEYAILTMSLVLIVAGYVSYLSKYQSTNQTSNGLNEMADIGDATLVNSNEITDNNTVATKNNTISNEVAVENDAKEEGENRKNEEAESNEKTEETNATPETEEYFISSRLERDNMYSQTIETYQDILSNTNCSVEQRNEASEKINKINETKNSIMISENLIKTKGFEDCVIFVNSDSISIVVKKQELSQEDIAKIQNIAERELSEDLENIHISNKY